MDASDRTSGHSPLHFDLSTFDIFGTFAAGAELYLVLPTSICSRTSSPISSARPSSPVVLGPSILNYLAKFDVVKPHDFPRPEAPLVVRRGISDAGPQLLDDRLPHVSFTNLYGPTEATIASSYYTVPEWSRQTRAPRSRSGRMRR